MQRTGRTPPESACSAGGAALARLGAFGIGALCAGGADCLLADRSAQVAVVVDNSASMRIRDNRFDRSAVARAVVEGIRSAFPADAVLPLRVGRTVETLPALVRDSFRFDDGATNLEAPFAVLAQRRTENVQAVVLITDGAYNTGGMPLYEALSLGKPVFTVGIGDTAAVKDAAITALVTNERGYKGVEMPVQVSVTADGSKGLQRSCSAMAGLKWDVRKFVFSRRSDSTATCSVTYPPAKGSISLPRGLSLPKVPVS